MLFRSVHSGRFPGLYLVITGTPAFYDGAQGAARLAPLAQRLATDFTTDPRFDNPRAVQIRLPGFDQGSLAELGGRVRDLYLGGASVPNRITERVDDGYLEDLAKAVAGGLGGKVGVAPRIYLKKLVSDILDRVDQFDDFRPREHYALTLGPEELTDVERNAAAGIGTADVDDVELDLP